MGSHIVELLTEYNYTDLNQIYNSDKCDFLRLRYF